MLTALVLCSEGNWSVCVHLCCVCVCVSDRDHEQLGMGPIWVPAGARTRLEFHEVIIPSSWQPILKSSPAGQPEPRSQSQTSPRVASAPDRLHDGSGQDWTVGAPARPQVWTERNADHTEGGREPLQLDGCSPCCLPKGLLVNAEARSGLNLSPLCGLPTGWRGPCRGAGDVRLSVGDGVWMSRPPRSICLHQRPLTAEQLRLSEQRRVCREGVGPKGKAACAEMGLGPKSTTRVQGRSWAPRTTTHVQEQGWAPSVTTRVQERGWAPRAGGVTPGFPPADSVV